jgi:hypothetical protein
MFQKLFLSLSVPGGEGSRNDASASTCYVSTFIGIQSVRKEDDSVMVGCKSYPPLFHCPLNFNADGLHRAFERVSRHVQEPVTAIQNVTDQLGVTTTANGRGGGGKQERVGVRKPGRQMATGIDPNLSVTMQAFPLELRKRA